MRAIIVVVVGTGSVLGHGGSYAPGGGTAGGTPGYGGNANGNPGPTPAPPPPPAPNPSTGGGTPSTGGSGGTTTGGGTGTGGRTPPAAGHTTGGGGNPGPTGGGTPPYSGPVGGGTPGPQPSNPTPGGSSGGSGGAEPPGNGGGGTTPGSGGGGSSGPAPGAPPVRPGGGRGAPAGGARPGVTGSKKSAAESRLLDWDWWWELNDDRYLLLRNRLRGETPTDNADSFLDAEVPVDEIAEVTAREIRQAILPALRAAIKDPYYDARAGVAIALGKIGSPADAEHFQLIRGLLADDNRIVRESACLALGLLGNRAAVRDLIEIAKNSTRGRRLAAGGTGDVPTRLRVFAAVAVGLIGSRGGFDPGDCAVEDLVAILMARSAGSEVQVGAALALQLVASQEALPSLIQIFRDPAQDRSVRAHVGVALGKCGARSAIGELLKGLEDKESVVAWSSAISLGLLVSRDDRDAVAKLIKFADGAPDRGTRNLCLIALGEIGDPKGRSLLFQKLKTGQAADASFAALALGIAARDSRADAGDIGSALLDAYGDAKDAKKAAIAIGIGLAGFRAASEALRKDLAGAGSQEVKAHLCTALGMLGDRAAIPAIHELVRQKGDPDLRRRAAVALGLLKDAAAVDLLQQVMRESAASKGLLGEATKALGLVGDRKAVPVLRAMLENRNDEHHDLTRAFASVALGLLGDKDDIPLLSRIHANSNYLAETEALVELFTIL